jgi:hypothetical protein
MIKLDPLLVSAGVYTSNYYRTEGIMGHCCGRVNLKGHLISACKLYALRGSRVVALQY